MFGVDFTWMGWIWIVMAILGILIGIGRGLAGVTDRTTPEESLFIALLAVLVLVGFFTVGFVE